MRWVLKTAECHIHVTHCYGNNKNRLVMMNYFAQESRSGSVLAERRALGVCTEMGGYRGGYV